MFSQLRSLPLLVPSLALLSSALVAEDAGPTPVPATSTPPSQAPEASESITIIGSLNQARSQIAPALGATTYQLSSEQIDDQALGADAPFNQVLLRMPGIAQDQYEQVHLRGEHANIQFRINGVLLPEGLVTFGQEVDTHFADTTTLITGSLPAQYGLRTAGVVDITTKTGAIDPGGYVSLEGGQYRSLRGSAAYGATVGRWDTFATASGYHASDGIENPTASWRPLHDDTNQFRGFLYVSYLINPVSRLSFITSVSSDRFEIPDVPGQTTAFADGTQPAVDSATLNEVQNQRNSYAVMAYQASLGQAEFQFAPYVRESQLVYTPDPVGDLEYNGVASSIDRTTLTGGFQLDGKLPLGDRHTLRAGAAYSATNAIINTATQCFPATLNPDGSYTQTSSTPETIIDNNSKLGSFYSLYLQDEWHPTTPWIINYGLRADAVQAFVNQQQLSPRINSVYSFSSGTTIHAGYSRYFTPPPLEQISGETESKFAGSSNAASVTDNSPLKCERGNYFDAGISQRLGSHGQIGIDGYYKRATDQLDEGQFGTAIILSPFNYRQGQIIGAELTSSYSDHDLCAYLNLALSQAKGKDLDSAQFLFSSQELAYSQTHWLYLDHDQRWTLSSGISYALPTRTRLGIDALFGTGLRDGFANTDHLPAYCTLNLSAIQTWNSVTARIDLENLFDRVYEIRDGQGIGVTAPSYGPRRSLTGGVRVAF